MTYATQDTRTEDYAKARGYTVRRLLECDYCEFEALVRPDADLDGTFRAFDCDNAEWLSVNGWTLYGTGEVEPSPAK